MAGAILSIIRWMASNKLVAAIRSSSSSSPSSEQFSCQEDLSKLESTLLSTRAVLRDAEQREIRDESVKLWLSELKGAAYDAEDALVEYGYEFLRAEAEGGGSPWPVTGKRRREEVTASVQASVPDGIASRIKRIRMRFDEIAEAREALQLRDDDGEVRAGAATQPPTTTPYVDESCVYGRDDDKEKLVAMLTSGDSFSVIPVVGMGGIGKTTLVRLVYNDRTVGRYFNLRVWICVSADFDVIKLCKAIMESVTKEPCDLTELSALQSALKEELKGKRLLLVLDDVWNEEASLWECLRAVLVGGGRRGIVVTTRNEPVAAIMQTVPPYRLGRLPEQQGWLLFQRCAFDGGVGPDANPSLIEVGMKIVTKCDGLPLAVKALGSLLRFETNEERWEDILQSDLWELDAQDDDILPALKLSYHRMPTHLKPCFTYCSVFPKNYLFNKDQLIRLWMAQGLIQHEGNRRFEDVGGEYFDGLLRRSFFEHSRVDEDELPPIRSALSLKQIGTDVLLKKSFFSGVIGDQPVFVMHDLIGDLARHIAGKECYAIADDKVSDIPTEARHLSLIPNDAKKKTRIRNHGCRALRTFLCINRMISTWNGRGRSAEDLLDVKIPKGMLVDLGCLRTLDLGYTRIEELPDSISRLKHLCYLGLQGSRIKVLPESLCSLYYLQTLDLKYCKSLRELPKGIVKLRNLRHLELPVMDFASCVSLPSGIGKLTSLQTLSAVNVARGSGHCGISELKELVNLTGNLGIAGLQNVANGKEAKEAHLKGKKHLQTLALQWNARDRDRPSSSRNDGSGKAVPPTAEEFMADGVFESLQPHTGLEQLIVRGYHGATFPSWLGNPSFSKLASVTISMCRNCRFLPPLGLLPCLSDLLIGNMDRVRHVGPEFCGHGSAPIKAFQVLRLLDFEGMGEWMEWDGVEDGDFPCLKRLVIKQCPNLKGLPRMLSSLEELEMEDVEGLIALPALPSLKGFELGGKWNDKLWSSTSSSEFQTLQSLEVSWSQNLCALPFHRNLHTIKGLEIGDCSMLASVTGLHELASLERLVLHALPELRISTHDRFPPTLQFLQITSCGNLSWLPLDEHLFALRDLAIVSCPRFTSVAGLQNLASLERLEISDCPELDFCPDEVLPSAIQSFEVSCCDSLRSLPVLRQNLTVLREMKIENCPQLASLAGINNLASLERLEISLCPELRLAPDEKLPTMNLDVDVMDCPRLVEWCQSNGIKHVQNDDWGSEESFGEDLDDCGQVGNCQRDDEGEENWGDDQGTNDSTDEGD